ncbi:MAG TPA: phosphotransferase [Intrasporangium sp.]|uniref:phosphotransferase n=1 Tax=Intrasporangium sp. TaxID=1925024 RepID=UPI002B495476|nr:phosphotransferase [Intrasporangium sp.]HKX68934.1 phosphotransferase [Intrasporangium sp.]
MTRSPLFLAALASAAVPGLDPVSVEGVRTRAGGAFDLAFVTDQQDRRWVVKAPLTQASGAELEAMVALGPLLGRRLDLAMPMVRGQVPVPEGRAVVYLRLPGRPVDFAALPPGDLASGIGRALAHIHNLDLGLFEEAGRPVYDAEAHRRRQLSELDRAASTGHVPTNLLTRWEQRLEDISLWRFAPTVVHGSFTGEHVLVSLLDEDRADAGEVRGVLGWEQSRIGDPADDFADLVGLAAAEPLDMVLAAYAQSRVERPDGNLLARARLAAEMTPMRVLLRVLAGAARDLVEDAAQSLRALDERVALEDELRAVEADREGREDRQDREGREDREDREDREALSTPSTPSTPELHPEPDWDATQPHQPFPDPSVSQAVDQPRAGPADEPGVGFGGSPEERVGPSEAEPNG